MSVCQLKGFIYSNTSIKHKHTHYPPTHPLTHSLTHPLTHPRTHSLTYATGEPPLDSPCHQTTPAMVWLSKGDTIALNKWVATPRVWLVVGFAHLASASVDDQSVSE